MHARMLVVCAAAAMAFGCASTPEPREEIARAEAAIERAEASQAAEQAPLEVRMAREKLEQARARMDDDENLDARRLAEKAEADAQLAVAKAERAQAQEAANAMEQTVRAIEEEIHR